MMMTSKECRSSNIVLPSPRPCSLTLSNLNHLRLRGAGLLFLAAGGSHASLPPALTVPWGRAEVSCAQLVDANCNSPAGLCQSQGNLTSPSSSSSSSASSSPSPGEPGIDEGVRPAPRPHCPDHNSNGDVPAPPSVQLCDKPPTEEMPGPHPHITSFQEMAQRRRHPPAPSSAPARPVPAPAPASTSAPARPGREDRSDWLIAFSPDIELPPGHREVTTFRELRYRSAGGQDSHCPATARPGDRRQQRGIAHGLCQAPPAGGTARARGQTRSPRALSRAGAEPGRRRGRADGRDRARREVGRSHSFPEEGCWDFNMTPHRDQGHVSTTLQQKRGLLQAVNVSLDRIVGHFSVARNLVQKAQLGDSRLSPAVGQLVLGDLCPAVTAIIRDGLKPYQQDLITGHRRNAPWGVVVASVRSGPERSFLYSLYGTVCQLPQLSNAQRFIAFIFGLLNLKALDSWISHLHSCTDVLRTHYRPLAFLALAQGPGRAQFEELLLLLQPLSVLSFHLDLLFQCHHFLEQPANRLLDDYFTGQLPTNQPPANQLSLNQPSALGDGTNRLGGQQAANEKCGTEREGGGVVGERERSAREWDPLRATLQKGLEQAVGWGEKLVHTLSELKRDPEAHSVSPDSEPPAPDCPQAIPVPPALNWDQRATPGWWQMLSLSSRVYLAPTPTELCGTDNSIIGRGWSPLPATQRGCQPPGTAQPSASDAASHQQPSPGASPGQQSLQAESGAQGRLAESQRPWLGRLFGAKAKPSSDNQVAEPQRTRFPSRWLQPNLGGWEDLLKSASNRTETWGRSRHPPTLEPEARSHTEPAPQQQPAKQGPELRTVRVLCDHVASETGHLSFRRGETLAVVACVDEDWIRCRHGDAVGLVPIGFTSLL